MVSQPSLETMYVSNGKALDLLFGPNSGHHNKSFFNSPPHHQQESRNAIYTPPPYHFHTHASSSSQQGTHQLGWKGGSGQACGNMMRAPRSNNDGSATTTDVLNGIYKTSDASLYNHQYHDNNCYHQQYVGTNYTVQPNNNGTTAVISLNNQRIVADQQQQGNTFNNTTPATSYSVPTTNYYSNTNIIAFGNSVNSDLPMLSFNSTTGTSYPSVFKQEHYQEQYNNDKQEQIVDRVAPFYCHDSVVVARSNQTSVPHNAHYALSQTNHYSDANHYDYKNNNNTTIGGGETLDVCFHDENTNLDNCKCHVRITRPASQFLASTLTNEQDHHSIEPHTKKLKLSADSLVETHSSSSSNASNSLHSESTTSRKNSLDGARSRLTQPLDENTEQITARKPIVSKTKKSNTKKPKSDESSTKKKSITKKASNPKPPVKFNVDLSKENLQDNSTIPIRILAYNLGLTKDIQKSWRYRDIRRALFERMIDEHVDFVDHQLEHSLLRERLPHKLTYSNFCKRVMLLVFHFVVRDGKEPKFFRRPLVQRDYIEKLLKENDPHFYSLVDTSLAHQLHELMNKDGKTFQEAINIVFKDLIDASTLQSLNTSSNHEIRKTRKSKSQKKPQANSEDDEDDESHDEDDESIEEKPAARPRRRASTDLKRKLNSDDSEDDDY